MSIEALRSKIEQLQGDLERLQPTTADQMHVRAMAGESAAKMVAANSKLAEQRAVLEIELGCAHAQLGAANKAAAQPRIEALLATRADCITDARKALRSALQAEQSLTDSLQAYSVAARLAEQAGNDANQAARQAGLGEQVARPELGQEIGNKLRQSIPALIQPFTGPQIYREVIEAADHE